MGSASFRRELERKVDVRYRFEFLGADRSAIQTARAGLWEERLSTVATAFGIALDRLPRRNSAREKVRLAAIMKAATSVSNRWLAHRLQKGHPGSVTQYVFRFRASGGTETRAFKRALSIVYT